MIDLQINGIILVVNPSYTKLFRIHTLYQGGMGYLYLYLLSCTNVKLPSKPCDYWLITNWEKFTISLLIFGDSLFICIVENQKRQ